MKQNKNSGFSLVELIIVVAILAVLIAILSPTYIKYVEKARTTREEQFADEIRRACEMLTNDTDENIEAGSYLISITPDDDISITASDGGNATHLDTYLKTVLGDDYAGTRLKSRTYREIEVVFSNTSSPACNIKKYN